MLIALGQTRWPSGTMPNVQGVVPPGVQTV